MIDTPSPIKNNLKTIKTNPYDEHFYVRDLVAQVGY